MKSTPFLVAFVAAIVLLSYTLIHLEEKASKQHSTPSRYEYTQFRFREMQKVGDEWLVCFTEKYYMTNQVQQIILWSNLTYTADEALNVYGNEGWKLDAIVSDPDGPAWTCYVLERPSKVDDTCIYVGQTTVQNPFKNP